VVHRAAGICCSNYQLRNLRHCERSEAIQSQEISLDYLVAEPVIGLRRRRDPGGLAMTSSTDDLMGFATAQPILRSSRESAG
jgi:hypothetical protein